MKILERYPLQEDNRVLVLRHFAENFEEIGAARRQDDTVSGEDPAF